MKRTLGFLKWSYDCLSNYFGKSGAPDKLPATTHPPMVSVTGDVEKAELEQALALLQAGKLDEAGARYRSLLQVYPNQSEALHFLGVVEAQRQNLVEAAALIGRAIEINPENAAAHSNHGNVLKALKRNEDALVSYDRALTLDPGWVEALNSRGCVLGELGWHEEALMSYERALKIAPDHMDVLINRGLSLMAMMRNQEALADFDRALTINRDHVRALFCRGVALVALGRHQAALLNFDRALDINPHHAEALSNRGNLLALLARHQHALENFDRALAIYPANFDALSNRGSVLLAMGRREEALASYDRALNISPDSAAVLCNRGKVLGELNRYVDALASYDRALAVQSDFEEAFNGRGVVLARLNRHADALVSYDRAVGLKPGYADAFSNRGNLLAYLDRLDESLASHDRALEIMPDSVVFLSNRGDVFRRMRLPEKAAQDYSRVLELDPGYEYALGHKLYANIQVCNWAQYDADRSRLVEYLREGRRACLPFSLLALTDSAEEQLICAQTFVAHKHPPMARALWAGERYRHKRIRIAYLSADLYCHVVTALIGDLFENHDKSRFEVSAWSFGPDVEDEMRAKLRKSFEHFNDVGHMTDLGVATMLRTQEIDIAVDLNGFTTHCRPDIFAHRAVPIQVGYLGYIGTMGADYMDYIIGDAEVIPVEHEAFYSEKVARLPDTYQVNSVRVVAECVPGRAEAQLPETGFVFCCFNNSYKITPEFFDIWMRLLKCVDGSVLWLSENSATVSRNLRLEAAARGVSAERLVFATRVLPPAYLARYRLADLFLDTLPYNAGTTASDALWTGLPVLTCRGNAFPGRMAASLLRAIGLPDLITSNLADYETLALKLATTPDMLADIKSRLARNRSTHPLFDMDRFSRHLESAYVTMYERYQRGESPQSFSVQPAR